MNFLALSGLQTLLLALATSGLIIALYLLKLRHRRVVVASSLLWGRVLEEREANSLWERLRRLISIVLAVLIGLLIALSAARPEIPWLTGTAARMVLVLDTSPTMLARTSNGQTRWERARTAALRLADSAGAGTQVRVADTSGRIDSGFLTDHRQVRGLLERMIPTVGPVRFPPLDGESGAIRFFTDGVSRLTLPPGVLVTSVFQEAPNVGITAFDVRPTPVSPLAYEAYLEVHNYGRAPRQTVITVSGTGKQRITRTVELQPGGIFREALDISRFEGGGIRATAQATGDAFSLDDTAYAFLPSRRRTRTLLVTAGNTYLETLLKTHPLADPTVIRPAGYRQGAGDYDVFIFDGFAPAEEPQRPTLLTGGFQDVAWLPRANAVVQNPKFGNWNETHPVMRFVSLHDVTIDRARRVEPGEAVVLAASDNGTPLILASPASHRPRWVMLTFSLAGSDLHLVRGFPLFIDNVLGWFSREPQALRRQPGLVEIDLPGAQVRSIDGTDVAVHPKPGGSVFQTEEPGLYIATNGDLRQHIAVNLANAEYSDINRAPAADEAAFRLDGGWLRHELWFYMLFAALVLITLEWFTYHRRVTL
jgi:hypothetical protein